MSVRGYIDPVKEAEALKAWERAQIISGADFVRELVALVARSTSQTYEQLTEPFSVAPREN